MSTLTDIREAIMRSWKKAAKEDQTNHPDKIWAERAAFAVVDLVPKNHEREAASKSKKQPRQRVRRPR